MIKTNFINFFVCFNLICFIGISGTLAQHSFYAGTNLRIAPIDNVVEVEHQVDPVYPGISRYQITPSFSSKMGYGYRLQFLKKMSFNAGLEFNQRKFSFDFTYDSIPTNYPYYIISSSRSTYNNLEIPISITIPIRKLKVSGGVNLIMLDLRFVRDFTKDGLVSKWSSFGYFPRLESEHSIFPFVKLEYPIFKTSDISLYASSAMEIRDFHGRILSFSFRVEFTR